MEDTRTMEDLRKEALAVQDACNLSGVLGENCPEEHGRPVGDAS